MEKVAKGYVIEDSKVKILFTNRTVDAKNSEDVKRICEEYNFNYTDLMYNTQVHGATVRIIKTIDDKELRKISKLLRKEFFPETSYMNEGDY